MSSLGVVMTREREREKSTEHFQTRFWKGVTNAALMFGHTLPNQYTESVNGDQEMVSSKAIFIQDTPEPLSSSVQYMTSSHAQTEPVNTNTTQRLLVSTE